MFDHENDQAANLGPDQKMTWKTGWKVLNRRPARQKIL